MQYEFDKRYLNLTITTFSDGIHDTMINTTADLYQPINNLFINLEVRTPQFPENKNYGKIIFRTRLDGIKILKGVRGNYLISLFADFMIRSMDFEPKLPAEKYSGVKKNRIFTDFFILFQKNLQIHQYERATREYSIQISKSSC